jgi:hypothetical protein
MAGFAGRPPPVRRLPQSPGLSAAGLEPCSLIRPHLTALAGVCA